MARQWRWQLPVSGEEFTDWEELDLLAEAIRRTVDLRDRLAEAGEAKALGSARAIKLGAVLNVLWQQALKRHLGDNIDDAEIIHTRPWELLPRLRADGKLS